MLKIFFIIGLAFVGIFLAVYLIAYPSIILEENDAPLFGFEIGNTVKVTDRIYYGPYQKSKEIEELQANGFNTIVTFLSPSIPAEAELIKREQELANRLKMNFYNFPLLPWEGLDENRVSELKLILFDEKNKSYLHCYRGVHRVKTVLVEAGLIPSADEMPEKFERGAITKFSNSLTFGPYPTDEEVQILVRSGYAVFVSLLSPEIETEIPWIEKERRFSEQFGIKYINFPMNLQDNSTKQADEIILYLKSIEGQSIIYVHDFHGSERVKLVQSEYEKRFYDDIIDE